MMKFLQVLLLLLPFAAVAQTPAPTTTFNLTASAIALPGNHTTVAGTVVGGTFAITPNFSLRDDNLIVPAANLDGFFGGIEYNLPRLSTSLNNISPNLNGNSFQFYLTGSFGVDRITPSTGAVIQHYAALAGGGVRYDPTSTGHFTVSLAEVRWAKLPGYANSTAIVSTGFKISW